MIGYGIAIGMVVGLLLGGVGGVVAVRWGMGIHERIVLGAADGEPVFRAVDSPYLKSQTDQEDDDDSQE